MSYSSASSPVGIRPLARLGVPILYDSKLGSEAGLKLGFSVPLGEDFRARSRSRPHGSLDIVEV